ncbi:MAG: hypothetical protein U1U88_001096 [Lawsonella clevelandensis]
MDGDDERHEDEGDGAEGGEEGVGAGADAEDGGDSAGGEAAFGGGAAVGADGVPAEDEGEGERHGDDGGVGFGAAVGGGDEGCHHADNDAEFGATMMHQMAVKMLHMTAREMMAQGLKASQPGMPRRLAKRPPNQNQALG